MPTEPIYYTTGEETRIGDRVRYRGIFATVVAVSDGETSECAPGYTDYSGCDRGIIICDDDSVVTSLNEPDEQLEFIERG